MFWAHLTRVSANWTDVSQDFIFLFSHSCRQFVAAPCSLWSHLCSWCWRPRVWPLISALSPALSSRDLPLGPAGPGRGLDVELPGGLDLLDGGAPGGPHGGGDEALGEHVGFLNMRRGWSQHSFCVTAQIWDVVNFETGFPKSFTKLCL